MWKRTTQLLLEQITESMHRIEIALQRPLPDELGDIENKLTRCLADLQELQTSCLEDAGTGASAGPGASPEHSPGADLIAFRVLVRRIRSLVDQAIAFQTGWSELARAEHGYGPAGELPPIHAAGPRVVIRG